ALVLQPTGAEPCDVAVAFSAAADGTPAILVVASAPAAAGGILDGGSGLKLNLQFATAGDVELELAPGQATYLAGPVGLLGFGLSRPVEAPITIGPSGGPNLTIHGISASITVALVAPGAPPTLGVSLA